MSESGWRGESRHPCGTSGAAGRIPQRTPSTRRRHRTVPRHPVTELELGRRRLLWPGGMPVVDDLLLVTQRDHRQWRRIAPACMGVGCSSCLGRDHPSWARIGVRRSTVRRLRRGGSLPRIHTPPLGVRIHDRDARCPQQDSNLLLVTSPVTAGPTFRHLARAGIWNCRVASLHHAPHAGGLAVGVVRGPSHSTGKGRGGCRFPSHTPAGGDSGLARPLTGVQPRTMTTRNFTIEFSNNKVSRHFGDRARTPTTTWAGRTGTRPVLHPRRHGQVEGQAASFQTPRSSYGSSGVPDGCMATHASAVNRTSTPSSRGSCDGYS